jgi:hypothetical protein
VDRYEFTDRCQPGVNQLAVLVHFVGREAGESPHLLAEVTAEGRVLAATGPHWHAQESSAWLGDAWEFRMNWFDPYQEWYDSRQDPADWQVQFARELGWKDPQVLTPFTAEWYLNPLPVLERSALAPDSIGRIDECLELENRCRPNDLSIALSMPGTALTHCWAEGLETLLASPPSGSARLGAHRPPNPEAGAARYNPAVVFDFGQIRNGCLELEVSGPRGAMIDLGFTERLIDGWFNNSLEGQFAARLVLRGGRQIFRTFSWRAQRYVKLRLRGCDSGIELHRIVLQAETAPAPRLDRFASPDRELTAIYRLCTATLQLCTHEQIVDTPWREQGQWLGDVAAVTAGGLIWATGGEAWVRKWHWESARSLRPDGWLSNVTSGAPARGLIARPIPDYSFWWVIASAEYWLFSGEHTLIDDALPVTESILRAAQRFAGPDGLLHEVTGWVFLDWAPVDKQGTCACLNALYAKALRAGAALAEAGGRPDLKAQWDAAYAQMRDSFTGRFWEEARGCLVDAVHGGRLSPAISEHTHAAALWAQLLGPAEAQSVIQTIFERKNVAATETQPFFTRVVLEALTDCGRFDLAEQILRARWGQRFVAAGLTTAPEEWSPNGSWRSGEFSGILRSLSHGWSAFPAEFLLRGLAGLRILEPGARRICLRPQRVAWDYRLELVLPHGTVAISHHQGRVTVTVPPEIELVSPEPAIF